MAGSFALRSYPHASLFLQSFYSFRTTFSIACVGGLGSSVSAAPLCQNVSQLPSTPRITRFWENVTELSVKYKPVNRGLSKVTVHTISIPFPSKYAYFIHLSLNSISYKLSKIFEAIRQCKSFQILTENTEKKYDSFEAKPNGLKRLF